MGPYGSLLFLIGPHGFLSVLVLMFSIWVFIGRYVFIWVFMSSYKSLRVLMNLNYTSENICSRLIQTNSNQTASDSCPKAKPALGCTVVKLQLH